MSSVDGTPTETPPGTPQETPTETPTETPIETPQDAAGASVAVAPRTLYPVASLDALRALAAVERPILTHTSPEIGASFSYRALTASELEEVMRLAGQNDGAFREYLVNRASVAPKVDHALWMVLGDLPALVRGKYVAAVMRDCGILPEAQDAAKKDSPPIRPWSPGTA